MQRNFLVKILLTVLVFGIVLYQKFPLVDKVKELDENWRKIKHQADNLRAERNKISEKINQAKKQKKLDEF